MQSGPETAIETAARTRYLISMLSTLKAIVQGDKIHWQETVDELLPADRPVEVLVTILEGRPNGLSAEERSLRRLTALQKLVEMNAFSQIHDPVEWQRDIREERRLP